MSNKQLSKLTKKFSFQGNEDHRAGKKQVTAELHEFDDVNDGDITAACGRNVNSRESVVVIDLEAASDDEPLPSRVSIQKNWPLSSHYQTNSKGQGVIDKDR